MVQDRSNGEIKSLRNSFRILNYIRENNGAKLRELEQVIDLSRSSIHNHLATLEQEGFVNNEYNSYHIGLEFLRFGEHARRRKPQFEAAGHYVEMLANETNEEADFTVEQQGRLYSLYHSVGDSRSSDLHIGNRFYMHNTSSGKGILAEMPREYVTEILDYWGMPKATEHTITDRDELLETLNRIESRGYAKNEEELMDGFFSIASVVNTPDGRTFGAISVGGPTYRIQSAINSADLVELLFDTVDDIERTFAEQYNSETNWWQEQYNTEYIR